MNERSTAGQTAFYLETLWQNMYKCTRISLLEQTYPPKLRVRTGRTSTSHPAHPRMFASAESWSVVEQQLQFRNSWRPRGRSIPDMSRLTPILLNTGFGLRIRLALCEALATHFAPRVPSKAATSFAESMTRRQRLAADEHSEWYLACCA